MVTGLLKAIPSEDAGQRIIYLEASNEALDQQNEVVLAKALAESADFYRQFGNLDVDHITQIGARSGIPDYLLYEIGRPIEVRIDGPQTFVKAQIYSGEGPAAAKANQVWDSLTKISPPARWFPSVGGDVLDRGTEFDPETKRSRTVIRKVRWRNIGLSRTPVNATVPTASTIGVGAFAKCWGAGGLDLAKALEAGYGTDVASLTGGGAMRMQSLDRKVQSYWGFRDRVSADIRAKKVRPSAASLIEHATSNYGVDHSEAAEYVERFLSDIKENLEKRKG
ncbi:MAG: hypothetical protein GC191_09165 [Azospirillum sp.]|nr:hypothetical protein [Azospirillum sp.]